jgi:peptidoglycan/LPS O-acetylase OafA/YrhL
MAILRPGGLLKLMQPARRFFTTLDGIRGIAAMAVAVVHAKSLFGMETEGQNGLAVDLFFVLSGVVVASAYEHRIGNDMSVRDFIRTRIIRLYPLYIFGTILGTFLIFSGIMSRNDVGYIPLTIAFAVLIVPNLFTFTVFPINFPAWSLFFELWVNIAYGYTLRSFGTRILAAIMAVSLLGLGAALLASNHHSIGVGWTRTNLLGGSFRVGYSFPAGVLLYRLFESRKTVLRNVGRGRPVPWLILGLVALALSAKPTLAIQPYYQLAVVVLFFPAIIYSALWIEPMGVGAKVCKFFGSVSYAVYTIHVPFMGLFTYVIVRMTGLPIESLTPWAGFLFLGILLPFCWAVDKFYDTPLRIFLRPRRSGTRDYKPEVLLEEGEAAAISKRGPKQDWAGKRRRSGLL